MARYQSLPDRVDTVCSTVPDQSMCINYGVRIDCNITVANTKCTFFGIGNANSGTWTVPPGVCSIVVELWGPGGGGGGGGNGTACTAGGAGGAGGYASATIPTLPGCQYTWCVGNIGCYGCCATRATDGGTTYFSGFNSGSLCAIGGFGACTGCHRQNTCAGDNYGIGFPSGNTPATSQIVAVGAGGTTVSGTQCHYTTTRGGAAPMNGGIGGVGTFAYNWGGHFPGGGAAGSCVTTAQSCGGCGGGGLVKIWY
jgi:hypothetical protein